MTQGELRQLANTSRKETLAALKRLDELGAIRRGYATIEIKDPVQLRRIADGVDAGERVERREAD